MRLETARSGACRSLKGRRCGVTDRGGFEVVAEYLLLQFFSQASYQSRRTRISPLRNRIERGNHGCPRDDHLYAVLDDTPRSRAI